MVHYENWLNFELLMYTLNVYVMVWYLISQQMLKRRLEPRLRSGTISKLKVNIKLKKVSKSKVKVNVKYNFNVEGQ